MDDSERLTALVTDSDHLPYDQGIPLLESAVELADATGNLELQALVRMKLAHAYAFGGGKHLAKTLGWLLKALDAGSLPHKLTHDVLWMNKWLIEDLLGRPDVDLDEVRSALDEMRERYLRNHESLQPVNKSAYYLDAHLFGAQGASAAYEAWVSAPCSDLSDCEACEPASKAIHLAALGRHAEAVDVAAGVLAGELGCAEEPETAIAALLPSLVLIGRGDESAELHALAWRCARDKADATITVARLIGFCARTGNLGRGVELLRARWADLDAPASAELEMMFCAHAARLGVELVRARLAGVEIAPDLTAADMANRTSARAVELADRFDRRNGTSAIGDRVVEVLAASDLGPVSLGALGRSRLGQVPVPERSTMPNSPDLRVIDPTDMAALTAAIEAADRWGGEAELLRISNFWELIRDDRLDALASADDSWQLGAAALLESRAYAALRVDDPGNERLANARDLYQRAGLAGEALLVEQRIARAAEDMGRVRAIVTELDRIGTLEEIACAKLAVLRSTHDYAEAISLTEEITAMTGAARDSWRIRGWIAEASAERVAEDPVLALAGVEQAMALLEPEELPNARGLLLLARAVLLRELGRADEASESALEAGRLAWDAGCPTLWAQVLTHRAHSVAEDDLSEAEELLAEASAAATGARQWQPAGQLMLNQAASLFMLGCPVQAAEIAERAVATIKDPGRRALGAIAASGYADEIGDLKRAREFAALAVREHAGLGPSHSALAALGKLGFLQWRLDDDEEALATFDAGVGQARLLGDPQAETSAHFWRSRPLRTLERYEEALAALDDADASLRECERRVNLRPDSGDLDEDDIAQWRRDIRASRARLHALRGNYHVALAVLGDVADWAEDPDYDVVVGLVELIRADIAKQEARKQP